jgi:hypothetical protein
MSRFSLHTIVAALCGSVLLAGCPADAPGVETEASTGNDSTGTTMTSTTVGMTMGMTMGGSSSSSGEPTTDVDTTVGVDDTTTGEPTSTSGPTTTGESTTGSTTTAESTTGEPPSDGYGDCINNPEGVACVAGEVCLPSGSVGFCSLQGCADASDCAVPATGDAFADCLEFDSDDITDCFLNCSGGATCPDGMVCYIGIVCVWEAVAPGGGMCPDQDLGNVVPQMLMGDNTGLFDDYIPSCGNGAEDSMYQFTAPAAGTYVFDTAGSMVDTILAVLDGCGGPELDCNDDYGLSLTSRVAVDLAAGQSVIVVVDGEVGSFNLNVTTAVPGACPDQDLGNTVPQMIMGDNTGLADDHVPSCSSGGGEDALYQFTAPAADNYVFDTFGTGFDTTLAVLDGCGGPELDCNDDAMGLASGLIIGLAAGQTVIISVDSFGGEVGPFILNIAVL